MAESIFGDIVRGLAEGIAIGQGVPPEMLARNVRARANEAADRHNESIARQKADLAKAAPIQEVPLDLGLNPQVERTSALPDESVLPAFAAGLVQFDDKKYPPDVQKGLNEIRSGIEQAYGLQPHEQVDVVRQLSDKLARLRAAEREIKPATLGSLQESGQIDIQPNGQMVSLESDGNSVSVDTRDLSSKRELTAMQIDAQKEQAMIDAQAARREARAQREMQKAKEEESQYKDWLKERFEKEPLDKMIDDAQRQGVLDWKRLNPNLDPGAYFGPNGKYNRSYWSQQVQSRLRANYDETRPPQLPLPEELARKYSARDDDFMEQYEAAEELLNEVPDDQLLDPPPPATHEQIMDYLLENSHEARSRRTSDWARQKMAAEKRQVDAESHRYDSIVSQMMRSMRPGGDRYPGEPASPSDLTPSQVDAQIEQQGSPSYGMIDSSPAEPSVEQRIDSMAGEQIAISRSTEGSAWKNLESIAKKYGVSRSLNSMIPREAVAASIAAGNLNASEDIAEAAGNAIKNKTDHFAKLSKPDQMLELQSMIIVPREHWDSYEFVPGVVYYDDRLNRYKVVKPPKSEALKEAQENIPKEWARSKSTAPATESQKPKIPLEFSRSR